MEQMTTAEPWQIAFFFVCCLVVTVVICVWLFTGNKASERVDLDPVGSVKTLWGSLLHWRAVPAGGKESPAPHEPEPLRSVGFSLLNGAEPDANRSENPAELQLNAGELVGLQRMIEHNKTAAKPSKSSTIQAGFGVSRGGSESYKRASLIYDTLFGPPAPAVKYRERTPEQEALRQQLHLNKH